MKFILKNIEAEKIIIFPFMVMFIANIITSLNSDFYLYTSIISKIIIALISIIYFIFNIKKNMPIVILTCLVAFVLSIWSLLKNDFSKDIYFDFFFFNFVSTLYFAYAVKIKNYPALFKNMLVVANLCFIVAIIFILLSLLFDIDHNYYSMSLGFYLLFPAAILFMDFIERNNMSSGMKSCILIFIIISFGSRGAIFDLLLFIVLCCFLFKNIIVSSVLFCLMLLFCFFYVEILNILLEIGRMFSFEGRTINMLLSNNFFGLSGRDVLHAITIDNIMDNIYWGQGIFYDRIILNGTYPHNILLEILLHFGAPITILFFILFLVILYKIFYSTDIYYKKVCLLYGTYGLFPLFTSGSYLVSLGFWCFLGIILHSLKKTRI